MSTNDTHDSTANGHGLPQDSWRRLHRLRKDIKTLLDLTRAEQPSEESAIMAQVRRDELTDNLAALHAQIVQVLHGLPGPAQSGEWAGDAEDDPTDRLVTGAEAPEADPPTQEASAKPYVSGVTLDQIDEMVLLLESLAAHGDVVTASDHAEFAPSTLSLIGYSICRELGELRDIVDTIHLDQQQEAPHVSRSGVREEHATYLALPRPATAGHGMYVAQPHPTYQ